MKVFPKNQSFNATIIT